jgi:hypothetical protein
VVASVDALSAVEKACAEFYKVFSMHDAQARIAKQIMADGSASKAITPTLQ